VQAVVVPVSDEHLEYARRVEGELSGRGVRVEVDDSENTMQKKIRANARQKVPYQLIVGGRESEEEKVNVRRRGQKAGEDANLSDFADDVAAEIAARDSYGQ
jgi:threonyl-tRNA synthetase